MKLTASEESLIEALAQTMFPADVAVGVDAMQANVVGRVAAHLDQLPKLQQVAMRTLFAGFAAGYRVHARQPNASFVDAEPEARQAYLTSVATSPNHSLRTAVGGLRLILSMAYLADPAVREAIGLDDDDVLDPGLEQKSELSA